MQYTYKLHIKIDKKQPYMAFVEEAIAHYENKYGKTPVMVLMPLDCGVDEQMINNIPTQKISTIQHNACGLVQPAKIQRTPRKLEVAREPVG